MQPDLYLYAFTVGVSATVIGLSGEFRRSRCLWNFLVGSIVTRKFGSDLYY